MKTIKNFIFSSAVLVAVVLSTPTLVSAEVLKSEGMFRNGEIVLSLPVAKIDYESEIFASDLPITVCTDLKDAFDKSHINFNAIFDENSKDILQRESFSIHRALSITDYSNIALAKKRVTVSILWKLSKRWPGLLNNYGMASAKTKPAQLVPKIKYTAPSLEEPPIIEPKPFKVSEFENFEYVGPGMMWDGEHYHQPQGLRISTTEDSVHMLYSMSMLDYCFGSDSVILLTKTRLDKFDYVNSSVHGTAFKAKLFRSHVFGSFNGRASVHSIIPSYLLDKP